MIERAIILIGEHGSARVTDNEAIAERLKKTKTASDGFAVLSDALDRLKLPTQRPLNDNQTALPKTSYNSAKYGEINLISQDDWIEIRTVRRGYSEEKIKQTADMMEECMGSKHAEIFSGIARRFPFEVTREEMVEFITYYQIMNSAMSKLVPTKRSLTQIMKQVGFSEDEFSTYTPLIQNGFKGMFKACGEHISIKQATTIVYNTCVLAKKITNAAYNLEESVPLYKNRLEAQFPTAERFLRHYYSDRLGLEGDLTITALKREDIELAEALLKEFAENPSDLHALLPNPTERADAKLMRALGYIPTGAERQKALTVLARGGQPGTRGSYKNDASR